MTNDFPGAVPEIPVRDLPAATAYYRDQLGFTLDWTESAIGLAGVSRGMCRIFLADAGFRSGYGNTGPVLTWLNLDGKEEVNALHREWSSRGATLQSAPESKPWGLHEFTALDPDGNLFRVFYDFATPAREAEAR
jgi:catechol 2,3-dioxygenase-like lactoylglutathione lyase family enzyme